jgi:hypothetical protein
MPSQELATSRGSIEAADSANSSASQADSLAAWAKRLAVPWGPLLTQEEAERGLAYYGSGRRLQQLAAKLMAGKPVKVSVELQAVGADCMVGDHLRCAADLLLAQCCIPTPSGVHPGCQRHARHRHHRPPLLVCQSPV